MRRSSAAWIVAVALLGIPGAAGQLDPTVDGCSRQCDPKADDVNGPDVRTGADPVKTVLYFHFQDLIQNAPINAQAPGEAEADLQGGFLMPTLVTSSDVCCHFKYNTFGGYSSAGFVEIVDGEWRTHQEHGVASDIAVLGDTIPLYFYLSAYAVPRETSESFPLGPNVPAAVPQVAVHATMNAGRSPGYGAVIAEGDTAEAGRVNVLQLPGREELYEFMVPLHVKTPVIPSVWNGGTGFTVSITPYQVRAEAPLEGWEFTQSEWRVHVGPKTPPHMVVEIAKPMATVSSKLVLFNNALFVRWSVQSPWGSYDVDSRNLGLQLTGPTSPDPGTTGLGRAYYIKESSEHDGHFKPTNITWKFDYRKAALADGAYTLRASIPNLQGTYRLEEDFAFRIENGLPVDVETIGSNHAVGGKAGPDAAREKAPGLAGVAVLAGLVCVALGRRFGPGSRPG
jgi:hypothetical protein